jgi:chromate transporter
MVTNKYYECFISGIKIAFLSFGGGASAIPFMKKEYLENRKWISEEEFSDMVILSNLLPGPTISQIVLLISKKKAGYKGALAGLSGLLFSTPIVLIILLKFMKTYLSPDNLEKLTIAILPVVIFMLVSFIFEFYKKSINRTGISYNIIVILSTILNAVGYRIGGQCRQPAQWHVHRVYPR